MSGEVGGGKEGYVGYELEVEDADEGNPAEVGEELNKESGGRPASWFGNIWPVSRIFSSLISRWTKPTRCIQPTTRQSSAKILLSTLSVKRCQAASSLINARRSPPGKYGRTRIWWVGVVRWASNGGILGCDMCLRISTSRTKETLVRSTDSTTPRSVSLTATNRLLVDEEGVRLSVLDLNDKELERDTDGEGLAEGIVDERSGAVPDTPPLSLVIIPFRKSRRLLRDLRTKAVVDMSAASQTAEKVPWPNGRMSFSDVFWSLMTMPSSKLSVDVDVDGSRTNGGGFGVAICSPLVSWVPFVVAITVVTDGNGGGVVTGLGNGDAKNALVLGLVKVLSSAGGDGGGDGLGLGRSTKRE